MKNLLFAIIFIIVGCTSQNISNNSKSIFDDKLWVEFAKLNQNMFSQEMGKIRNENKNYKYCYLDIIDSESCDYSTSERCNNIEEDITYLEALQNKCLSRKLGMRLIEKYDLENGSKLYYLLLEYDKLDTKTLSENEK